MTYFNPGESAGMFKGKNAVGLIDLKNLIAKRIFNLKYYKAKQNTQGQSKN